jgi:hypothetical protein
MRLSLLGLQLLPLLLLGLASTTVSAETYTAALNGAGDNVTTTATGNFMANCTALACNYTLDVANITNMYQAHLHLGNKTVADGPIVVFLLQPLMPFVSVTGVATITGTFNTSAFTGPYNTSVPFSTLTSAMGSSGIYANVHSKEYPAGVIRGQTAMG